MSMAEYEPDRDAGDENAYEQRIHVSSGLCERCHNDAQLPDDLDGWCGSCVAEVEGIIHEMEDAA